MNPKIALALEILNAEVKKLEAYNMFDEAIDEVTDALDAAAEIIANLGFNYDDN